MTKSYTFLLTFIAAIAFLLSGCGNPFGKGSVGLRPYALLGKKMEKPKSINDEDSNKETAKKNLAQSAETLARRMASGEVPKDWVQSRKLSEDENGNWVYTEVVKDKPSEEDPALLNTGTAQIVFSYDGIPVLDSLDESKITDLHSWHFLGRNIKTWNPGQIDSVEATVRFASSNIDSLRPGKTDFWGLNISTEDAFGKGDSVHFSMDSLDEASRIQFGEGSFFDAKTGEDNDGESKEFNINIQILHKNNQDSTKPYLRYEDNEGIVSFQIPWGESSDELYFTIHFYPGWDRTGTIRKNGPDGLLLAEFTNNEKTGEGEIVFYDEDGKVVNRE